MSLLEVRTQLIKITGRYDLVVDAVDYADNGADFYINAGQLWLDRRETHKKSFSRVFETVSAGEWYLTFQLCRAIKEVWISNSDGEKWKLEKDCPIFGFHFKLIHLSTPQGHSLYRPEGGR